MDEKTLQLIMQVMYAGFPRNRQAAAALQEKGVPESTIEEWKRKGFFLKDAAKANPPDNTRVIRAESIREPYFSWQERKSREQAFPPSQSSRYTARPDRTRVMPSWQAGGHGLGIGQYLSENYIQLSTLGMDVAMMGGDYKLYINNFDLLEKAAKNGRFVANWNGQQVWSLKFFGNAHVPSDVIAAEKAAFQSTFKTLKLVKNVGRYSAYLGAGMSIYEGYNKGTTSAYAKTGLDLIMTRVAFIPPYGWVASGLYFIADGVLSLTVGEDWWELFWNNYIAPLDDYAKEAIEAFDKADRTHRRITGRGLLQGSKL